MNGTIHPKAADRLAEALAPLAGHAPGHSEDENALRMKSAADTRAPAVSKPPAVTAADFGASASGFPFGLQTTAAALRKLADAVERGDVNPQRVTVLASAPNDDFHETTLTFTYNDKQGVAT